MESSFLVFMSIALDGWIREMLGFLYRFRSVKSVGRSSNVLIISSGWLKLRLVGQDVVIDGD